MPVLDGARGLAVLLVLIDHASDSGMRFFGVDINRTGKYGVHLFFVLSAFLLTYQFSLKSSDDLAKAKTWANYAFRRFMRIFPLYAFILVILHPGLVVTHLLLRDGQGPFWTIPVEVKYYILLPFIALALLWTGRRQWQRGLVATIAACVVGAALFYWEGIWSLDNQVLLSRNMAPFIFGTAAAIVWRTLERRPLILRRLSGWLAAGAVVSFAVILLRIPSLYNAIFDPPKPVYKFAEDELVCAIAWSIFLLGLLGGKGWMARAMAWLPLRFVGWISFSAYLWHKKLLDEMRELPVPSTFLLLIFVIALIAVSTVSYLLVERPFSRLRLGQKKVRGAV